jgi:4-amino-4-deoxychorismate mutase
MERLSKYRKELDKVDEQLMALIARRFNICRQVATYKAEYGIPMMQPVRVAEVKRRAASRALARGLSEEFATALYDLIISEACGMETEIIEKQRDQHVLQSGCG